MDSIKLLPIQKTELPYFTNNSLSVKQNDAHYTGHYLKYIENFNKLMNNNTINVIYKKYNPSLPNQRYLFLLAVIMYFDKEKKKHLSIKTVLKYLIMNCIGIHL